MPTEMRMQNRLMEIRRFSYSVGIVLSASFALACSTRDLLEVNDPDIVKPIDVESPAGTDAVRLGAIQRWRLTTGADNTNGQESTWLFGGLLADEWGTGSTFVQNDEADKRSIGSENSTVTFEFRK